MHFHTPTMFPTSNMSGYALMVGWLDGLMVGYDGVRQTILLDYVTSYWMSVYYTL